ncbi:uncharacterized protein METZ01_LOCUS305151, partial [marine metagenome]
GAAAYAALADQSVAITTVDDETAGFTVSTLVATVSESGSTATLQVVLDSEPTVDQVTISVTGSDAGEATVDTAELIFTSSNWNSPQGFTITGIDDPTVDGNQASTVTLAASSADSAYAALPATVVDVTTTDDDAAGFTATATDGTTEVSEFGSSDTIAVVLSTKPTGTVMISVTASDPSEAVVSPTILAFTQDDWNVPQDVTVGGLDDSEDDGDITSTVTISVMDAATAATEFAPVADLALPVVTIDDDEPVTEEPEDVVPGPDGDDDDEATADPDSVSLTGDSFCSAVQVFWTPDVGTAVASFVLASQAPGATWVDHEAQPGSSDRLTLGGLANGTHSFQVQATLVDGSSVVSDAFTTEVVGCAPIDPTPEVEVDPT